MDCNKLDPARLQHDEVAVMEVDDYPEPPVNESNAVGSPHVMSKAQKPSSNMKSDFANGANQEVTVVEKVSEFSKPILVHVNNVVCLPHFISEDRCSQLTFLFRNPM